MKYLKCLQDVRAYYIPRVLRMREGGADGERVGPCTIYSSTRIMGSCYCLRRGEHSERTPIVQPSVDEASARLEKQRKTLEGDIEKLRQDLEETR